MTLAAPSAGGALEIPKQLSLRFSHVTHVAHVRSFHSPSPGAAVSCSLAPPPPGMAATVPAPRATRQACCAAEARAAAPRMPSRATSKRTACTSAAMRAGPHVHSLASWPTPLAPAAPPPHGPAVRRSAPSRAPCRPPRSTLCNTEHLVLPETTPLLTPKSREAGG